MLLFIFWQTNKKKLTNAAIAEKMEINKIHCLFEQSGTFKNEFIKLGYKAKDYDIENRFGETDIIIDIFKEINKAYKKEKSIFDEISEKDLIIAFYPCTYFETIQQLYFNLKKYDLKNKKDTEKIKAAIKRLKKRTEHHILLYKLLYIVTERNLKLILENPATEPNYLITGQNFIKPTIIDNNRKLKGDIFKKPTAYWFINCKPGLLNTIQKQQTTNRIDKTKNNITRSIITTEYAKNFIYDYIIEKPQKNITQLKLF